MDILILIPFLVKDNIDEYMTFIHSLNTVETDKIEQKLIEDKYLFQWCMVFKSWKIFEFSLLRGIYIDFSDDFLHSIWQIKNEKFHIFISNAYSLNSTKKLSQENINKLCELSELPITFINVVISNIYTFSLNNMQNVTHLYITSPSIFFGNIFDLTQLSSLMHLECDNISGIDIILPDKLKYLIVRKCNLNIINGIKLNGLYAEDSIIQHICKPAMLYIQNSQISKCDYLEVLIYDNGDRIQYDNLRNLLGLGKLDIVHCHKLEEFLYDIIARNTSNCGTCIRAGNNLKNIWYERCK